MKKKICIIGPFPPFMGGIPQYNELLARELFKTHEVTLISYKRQYPKFLINNREQIDKKHIANDNFLSKVQFIIDSINPISWFKTARLISKNNIDLVILPWWVIFWSPMYVFFMLYFKLKKIKTLMICHNVFEHDDGYLKRIVSKITLKLSNYYLVHSSSEQKRLETIIKNKVILKHLIPLFNFTPKKIKNHELENKDDSLKLLFFGAIREYKGLDLLLDALADLNDKRIELVIVGDFWNGSEHYDKIIKAKKIANVTIINQYIPDESIQGYFDRCDLLVLPYKSATGSAVIPLAYSFKKPVLVTNVGGLPEAVIHKKTGYIVEPTIENIAEGIQWFLTHKTHNYSNEIHAFVKSSMSWPGLVKSIVDL